MLSSQILRQHFFYFTLLFLVLPKIQGDYCSKHDCTPKTYQVKISRNVNLKENNEPLTIETESEMVNKCWKYTWLGPIADKTNQTTTCDRSPEFDDVPCFSPIVWTNGTNKFNEPNLDELWQACKVGQTIQGTVRKNS